MKTFLYLVLLFPWSAAALLLLRFLKAERKPEAVVKQ